MERRGFLIQEGDVEGFLESIQNMALRKVDVRAIVNETFAWSKISAQYKDFISPSRFL